MSGADAPLPELKIFHERRKRLVGLKLTREGRENELDLRSKQLLKDVEQLVRELAAFRLEHPESADLLVKMENQLLDCFPEAHPDSQTQEV
jgi:hypothetical protein